MLAYALHFVTFITNLIILISFIWLNVGIEQGRTHSWVHRHAAWLTVATTTLFLLFFHIDSLLNIANNGHPVGYGWTFMNFQIAIILYATLTTHAKAMIVTLTVIVATWFVWMDARAGLVLGLFTLVLLAIGRRFGDQIAANRWLYYPFALLFAAPAFAINYRALGGIDVGWPF